MVYLNNAASSFPKPPEVAQAMLHSLMAPPRNPYREAGHDGDAGMDCRRKLARLINCRDSERIIFTGSATLALNMVLGGLLRSGGLAISSQAEHNAILRPLAYHERRGTTRRCLIPCDGTGRIDIAGLVAALSPAVQAVCLSHVSNVTGLVTDIMSVHDGCQSRRIPLIIDAAQSMGCVPLSIENLPWAVVVFAGHKCLGGPPGTGGFVLGREINPEPWFVGGVGIHSEGDDMPAGLPMRFEPGSPNEPAIEGLSAALDDLAASGILSCGAHKSLCTQALFDGLRDLAGIHWFCAPPSANPSGIVSFTLDGWSATDLSYVLDQSYGIKTRPGLHCAPLIHQALGTRPDGTLRISFSRYTTLDDVAAACSAIREIRTAS